MKRKIILWIPLLIIVVSALYPLSRYNEMIALQNDENNFLPFYVENNLKSKSFSASEPDNSLINLKFDFIDGNTYGNLDFNIFSIIATLGDSLPLQEVRIDNEKTIDYGILEKYTLNIAIYVVIGDQSPLFFDKQLEFNESTSLEKKYLLKWSDLDYTSEKSIYKNSIQENVNLFFSLQRIYEYNNRTTQSVFGSRQVEWSKNNIPSLNSNVRADPTFTVIWVDNNGYIFAVLVYFIEIIMLLVAYFILSKKKII